MDAGDRVYRAWWQDGLRVMGYTLDPADAGMGDGLRWLRDEGGAAVLGVAHPTARAAVQGVRLVQAGRAERLRRELAEAEARVAACQEWLAQNPPGAAPRLVR